MKSTAQTFIIVLICLFIQIDSQAQTVPGKKDSIYSEVLKEQRTYHVVYPRNYNATSKEKWDVVYVLDGEWNTDASSYIHNFVSYEKFVPNAFIVGVPNRYIDGKNQRERDFLPVHDPQFAISGKAGAFLTFLKTELIPHINKNFPTTNFNTLHGHSFGGVFTVYALLADPTVFENYIATDPAFWWNNNSLSKMAAENIGKAAGLKKALWIGGIEETYKGMGIDIMDSVLKANAPKDLVYKNANFPNETHNSVRFKALYDGLKFVHSDFSGQSIQFHPANGIVIKDKPFKVWTFTKNTGAKYTLDGSEPTATSADLLPELTMKGPAKLNIKSMSLRGKYDVVVTGEFKDGKTLKATSKPKNTVNGGFKYSFYEGTWDKLPDFKTLTPKASGITGKDFDIERLPAGRNFACLVEGFIEIQKEGYYIFGLSSDDGSKLYLGNQLLINYDGVHESPTDQSFIVPLEEGFYPIRLEYFQKDGDRRLNLVYVTPDVAVPNPVTIPVELQYRKK